MARSIPNKRPFARVFQQRLPSTRYTMRRSKIACIASHSMSYETHNKQKTTLSCSHTQKHTLSEIRSGAARRTELILTQSQPAHAGSLPQRSYFVQLVRVVMPSPSGHFYSRYCSPPCFSSWTLRDCFNRPAQKRKLHLFRVQLESLYSVQVEHRSAGLTPARWIANSC